MLWKVPPFVCGVKGKPKATPQLRGSPPTKTHVFKMSMGANDWMAARAGQGPVSFHSTPCLGGFALRGLHDLALFDEFGVDLARLTGSVCITDGYEQFILVFWANHH